MQHFHIFGFAVSLPPLSLPISPYSLLSLPILLSLPPYLSLSPYLSLFPFISPYPPISHGLPCLSLCGVFALSLCAVRPVRYALDATGYRLRLCYALDAGRYQSAQDHGARLRALGILRALCLRRLAAALAAGRRRQHIYIFLIYNQHMPTGTAAGRLLGNVSHCAGRPPSCLFLGCVILCAPFYHLGHVRFNSFLAV